LSFPEGLVAFIGGYEADLDSHAPCQRHIPAIVQTTTLIKEDITGALNLLEATAI
jgi:hypothetical protein